MKDKEFLTWIHGRLIGHGENQNCDHMLKFKAIIDITPPDQETRIGVEASVKDKIAVLRLYAFHDKSSGRDLLDLIEALNKRMDKIEKG